VAEGHKGVMAKHQASRYLPGQRSPSWRKIKPSLVAPCVIIGYQAGRSTVSAWPPSARVLRYVGQLTRGFTAFQAIDLMRSTLDDLTVLGKKMHARHFARSIETDTRTKKPIRESG
jgi:ATP-dependent DNA ligase